MKDRHSNLRFAFDHVVVRHAVTAIVDDETRTQAAGSLYQNNAFADLCGELFDTADWQVLRSRKEDAFLLWLRCFLRFVGLV